MPEMVSIEIDRRKVEVAKGSSVAAAILMFNELHFRTSVSGQRRGAICGMGVCFECRVSIDGRAGCRSCLCEVSEGMIIVTS